MSKFKVHNKESAKPASADLLSAVEGKYGFIPNLMGIFAESTSALQAYIALSELVSKSAFNPEEQQALLLAVSFENNCDYCVAAHSMMASKMAGMPADRLEAIRQGKVISDKKINELVRFTREVVASRGNLAESSVNQFLNAGYTNQHVLEVILGVAMKTLSNYTNHLAKTPVDGAFAPFKWSK